MCSVVASLATALLLAAPAARASCIRMRASDQRAQAKVIFDGTALQGPTATGIQRFRVTTYRKGSGPGIVRVSTGVVRHEDGAAAITSVSIFVKKGERWRIFGSTAPPHVVRTNVCLGSRRL